MPRDDQPVYMISVAAKLASMHPQTLRLYERKKLISPERTGGQTRLYSARDIKRLQRIQALTDNGLNLAGVRLVLELTEEVARLQQEMEEQLAAVEERLRDEVRAAHQQYRRELAVIPKGELVRFREK